MVNKAAWIPAAKATVEAKDDDATQLPEPTGVELLVKVKSIAFSPIEAKIQKYVVSFTCLLDYFL